MDLASSESEEKSEPGLETLSRVRISVQTQQATKIVRSARVSFSSQVANLGKGISLDHASDFVPYFLLLSLHKGGIIGLFTGMSILSWAESIYWVIKYIKHVLFPKNPGV